MEVQKAFYHVEDTTIKVEHFIPETKYQFHKSYMFNVGMAEKYGVNEAIIINNLIFWIETNKANGVNFFDGYYWTFNSIRAFKELFPFWTDRQIRYIFESLEKKGIIKTGNYNKKGYDKTLWYTIIDNSILQFCQMSVTNLSNECDKNVKPIPDINTDINTDIKPDIKQKKNETKVSNITYSNSNLILREDIKLKFQETYKTMDIEKELKKMEAWLLVNPAKVPKKNFGRFVVGWLNRTEKWNNENQLKIKKEPDYSNCSYQPLDLKPL